MGDELDKLDRRIIDMLGQDARRSNEELAKQLKVSPATVRRRVKRLLDTDVMRVVGVFDPNKIGLPITVCLGFDVMPKNLGTAMDIVSNWPETRWVASTSGSFNIMALTRFPSHDALSAFLVKELARLEGLRDNETFICMNVKSRYLSTHLNSRFSDSPLPEAPKRERKGWRSKKTAVTGRIKRDAPSGDGGISHEAISERESVRYRRPGKAGR